MAKIDFHLIVIDSFLIPMSFNLVVLSVPLKGLNVGLSEGIIALILFISNLVQLFGRPLFGYLSDKLGAKKFIILASLLYSSGYSIFFISKNIIEIFLGAILLGLGVSSQWSALFSYISKRDWGELSELTGSTLSFSFFGAVIGLSVSGFIVELYGIDLPFLISSLIALTCFFVILPIESVEGSSEVNLISSLKITFNNIGETLGLANSMAIFPIIRTYGVLLMINAGITETVTGLVLTSYRLINALLQKLSARISSWILSRIHILNILTLLNFSIFAVLIANKLIVLSLLFFIIATVTNSLLPTAQLVKAISMNSKYSASGVAGFGTGLSLGRIVATGVGSIAGGYEEQNGFGMPPSLVAFLAPILIFMILTSFYKLFYK